MNTTDPTTPGLFLPVYAATASNGSPVTTFTGMCYNEITMTYNQVDDSTFEVTVELQDKSHRLCKEAMLFSNTEINHFEIFLTGGTHKMTFHNVGQDAITEEKLGGIKAYFFCESLKNEFESFKITAEMFLALTTEGMPKIVPDFPQVYGSVDIEEAFINFVNITMEWEWEPREIKNVDLDPSQIRSGDFIAMTGIDALSAIIMYGSASYIDHSLMFLWFEDGLYIVESTDPVIKRTPFETFMNNCHRGDTSVSWLPLSDEMAEKFNETAAREFYFAMEGVPYGYHNFLYGWVDTPEDNWPPVLPHHFAPILFSWVEHYDYDLADNMFTEALNLRLGVKGHNITETAAIAAEQGMLLEDVMAMVEKDSYRYTGLGPMDGRAFVCSAFVTALWNAAGLFDPYEIEPAEFTPGDVYRMNFFSKEARPDACVEADPDLEFCQFAGKYRQELPKFNTIAPYSHMNERCPSIAPEFYRPDGC